jgi:protease-4
MMASAAYWLGAQCKNILVSQSAVVGSIGVYIAFLTFEKHLALEGIEAEVIQAGKYKTLGINLKDLTQEEREYLQSHVDKTYSEFKAALGGRNLDDETMQGETYDGENALKLKLVDGIQDSFEDLITMLQG